MLAFLIGNIYVDLENQVLQQSVEIPKGPIALRFLYSYEAEFIQRLGREKTKSLNVVFNSSFRYIEDVLSINNYHFHSYVDSICPTEVEIKVSEYFTRIRHYSSIVN